MNEMLSVTDIKEDFSPQEAKEHYLSRIEELNSRINAYVEILSEEGQAKDIGKLAGVPYCLKDNLMFEGTQTTCASRMLEDYEAPYTATVVKRLSEAGAILLGKTNMDEFAMGSATKYSIHGPTVNPHSPEDKDLSAGGSSGGTAAAVASGMAAFGLGSDTGGSVRQPASFCGVVGFKPTYGVLSRFGLVALSSSLDQVGVVAKSVEDVQLIMDVMAGPDEYDQTSLDTEIEFTDDSTKEQITLGIPDNFFGDFLADDVGDLIKERIDLLADKDKFKITEVELPDLETLLSAYYVIQPAEASSNLARYDGVTYGFAAEAQGNVFDKIQATRTQGFGEEAKRRIIAGTFALSSGYKDEYYSRAVAIRDRFKAELQEVFEEIDFLIGPTTPDTAFALNEFENQPTEMYYQDILTIPANLAETPAVSLPVGQDSQGLPIGLQVMGPKKSDNRLLNWSKKILRCFQ